MSYFSPFHFIPSDIDLNNVDSTTFQRAKKKLLAELELDAAVLGGMTKDEMLKWFDSLSPAELKHHLIIYQHKPLLGFLEHGTIPDGNWYNIPTEHHAFVQPLVQAQYDSIFTDAFRNADIGSVQALARVQLPDLSSKGRYYYSGALNLLTAYYQQLLQLTDSWDAEHNRDFVEFLSMPFIGVIPYLPAYFNSMRDEFALTMMKFAGQICEKPKDKEVVELAKHIASVAPQLGVSAAAAKEINVIRNKQIYTDEVAALDPSIKKESNTTRKGCARAFLIFFLISTLVRIILAIVG